MNSDSQKERVSKILSHLGDILIEETVENKKPARVFFLFHPYWKKWLFPIEIHDVECIKTVFDMS